MNAHFHSVPAGGAGPASLATRPGAASIRGFMSFAAGPNRRTAVLPVLVKLMVLV
jgi:hypothetical protein